jgi:ABC-type glycerol-3-phosphate transport system permease component
MRARRLARGLLVEGLVAIAAVATIAPVVWLVVQSMRLDRDIISPGFPFAPTLDNFAQLFADDTYVRQLANSVMIMVGTTLACVAVGALAGYTLSQLNWPRWVTVSLLSVTGLIQLVPPMTLIPGLYVTLANLQLLGSVAGLILLNTVFNLPFTTVLAKVFFDALPGELREAALVDGASEARCFRRVMLPLAAPGIAAAAIATAIFTWNEFLMGLTLTTGGDTAPLTVGIGSLIQPYDINFGPMAAAGAMAAVPIILLTVVANRYIVSGLTQGAVKG